MFHRLLVVQPRDPAEARVLYTRICEVCFTSVVFTSTRSWGSKSASSEHVGVLQSSVVLGTQMQKCS